MVMLGKDGNIYGLNESSGGIFYTINKDGISPIYEFDYGHVGPMAEFEHIILRAQMEKHPLDD
jgi:hypothetical protein